MKFRVNTIVGLIAWGTVTICLALCAFGEEPKWQIKMEAAESCDCAPACPCIFGSSPTHGDCHVNLWLRVTKGRYGKVRLDDVSLVTAEQMGKWAKVYFDTKTSAEQIAALTNVLKQMPEFKARILSVQRSPVSFERKGDRIRFSVPESFVEMEVKKGRNGKPITVQNIGLADYVQFVSITNRHQSEAASFAYSGTSGGTWTYQARSKTPSN